MLQKIRDRAQGWLATLILVGVTIPFVFWGIDEYLRVAKEVVVAEIDGEEVSLREFQHSYQRYRQRLQSLFGSNFDPKLFDETQLKKETLDQLVDTRLLLQLGQRTGMRISNEQVAAAIQGEEAFQKDGKFAATLYEQRLKSSGLNPVTFEEQLRQGLLTEQLQQMVSGSAFVTTQELEKAARLEGQQRNIAYTTLPIDPVKPTIQISDEEIKKHYEGHRDQYTTPEQVKIAYLDLSLDELAKKAAVTDEDLRGFYQAHVADYAYPEQRSASHILVEVPKNASAAEVETATKKAEEFAKLARQGESFEKIVKEHSDDPGSKGEGGQTGFFVRGVMEKPFEDAAFSMKPGEISDPVRTDFGYHVIRLNEIKEGRTKSFEEVRGEVEKAYRQEQAEKVFYDQLEQLEQLTYENPDDLQAAADALGLTIQESDYFTRGGGKGFMANPKVLAAAFSPEVLEEGQNSEPLELESTRVMVLRLRDHKPAASRPLEEVRKEIVDTLTLEKAKEVVADRGKKLLERLKGGEDRAAMAQQEQLKWEEAMGVDRESPKVNHAVLREAFKIGRPAQKPLFGSVQLGTGDIVLFAVLNVQDPEPEAIDEKTKNTLRDSLKGSKSQQDWQDFMGEIRRGAKINLSLKDLSSPEE